MLCFLFFSTIALSLDGLAAGIILGLQKLKIAISARIWIALFSSGFAAFSIFTGDYLGNIIPPIASKFLGAGLLCFLGGFQVRRAIFPVSKKSIETEFSRTFRFWDLTIQIIREPTKGDLDGSGIIENKEAFFLGLSLSVDMLGAGIGLTLSGINSWILIPLVGIVQSLGLWIGERIGQKVNIADFNPATSRLVSGGLLCLLGIVRLF